MKARNVHETHSKKLRNVQEFVQQDVVGNFYLFLDKSLVRVGEFELWWFSWKCLLSYKVLDRWLTYSDFAYMAFNSISIECWVKKSLPQRKYTYHKKNKNHCHDFTHPTLKIQSAQRERVRVNN